jgi:hypothetical protein
MEIYRNISDGLLYGFKWIQERITDPAVLYAVASEQQGRDIRDPNRMDFVTLSPAARSRAGVPPVDPTADVGGVEK